MMRLKVDFCLLLATLATTNVFADVYFHIPRGSNNRLNEDTRDRQNAKRLFDSENNARGGYNVGEDKMYYHAGSILSIEWTNQHSCNGPNNNCNLVLQYMCGKHVRNGETVEGIPVAENSTTNDRYGMHEDYEYYHKCTVTQRNKGLFLADQNLEGVTQRYTRQNNNGQRHGFECPEERDYYPHWSPSPWKDIAVMTSDTSRCKYYQTESQNVKERYQCVVYWISSGTLLKRIQRKLALPITEEECKQYAINERKFEIKTSASDFRKHFVVKALWVKTPAHNIPAPKCLKAPESRDNHNGNGRGGFPNTYNWTIPNDVNDNCVLRIRYNISTGDYPWDTDSNSKLNVGAQADIYDLGEANDRGYTLTGNPNVLLLKVNGVIQEKFELKLAINTAQFGRTFQDRSHVFSIIPRPSNIPNSTPIYNLNVRGKRGNIVQVYPAVEYDFAPNRLHLKQGDVVHIQWTGSNTNPENNAGQGAEGEDRHNMVRLTDPQYDAVKNAKADKPYKYGHWANNYPAHLDEVPMFGFSLADRKKLAYNVPIGADDGGQLDETPAYFDLGVRRVWKQGAHRYMCSRNNQFTNRGQKGVITVSASKTGWISVIKPVKTVSSVKTFSKFHELRRELDDIQNLEEDIKHMLQ